MKIIKPKTVSIKISEELLNQIKETCIKTELSIRVVADRAITKGLSFMK